MRISEVLATFHAIVAPRAYLQLGLDHADLLNLARCGSVVVAPSPRVTPGAHAGKPWLKLYDAPRDEFLTAADRPAILEGEPLDLALLDGGPLADIARDLELLAPWVHPATVVLVLSPDGTIDGLAALARAAIMTLPRSVVRLVAAEREPLLMLSGLDPAMRVERRFGATDSDAPHSDAPWRELVPVPVETAIAALGRQPVAIATRLDRGGWLPSPINRRKLQPSPLTLASPVPRIAFDPAIRNAFRVRLRLSLSGMESLRLEFRSVTDVDPGRVRAVWLEAASPGALEHEIERVALHANSTLCYFELECDGVLEPGEALRAITLSPAGADLEDTPVDPAMAIEVLGMSAEQMFAINRVVRFVPERFPDREVKRQETRRHAIVFAWYVPEEYPDLGAYYLGLLRYHHADAKLFIGMNHGSDPRWERELETSGLDVDVRWARGGIDDYWDTTGFLTALEGYHRSREPFALVWFGHTKGASEPDSDVYRSQRYHHHRAFWARREAIERAFRDPAYGLFAPRFNLTPPYPWPEGMRGWDGELAALRRVYRDRCQPLGLCAYETVYVMRDEIVRRFCDAVGDAFFRTDPGEFGANKWFFEMAFPSIASMQGYEPYIDMVVAGADEARDDVTLFDDPKQNHRLAQEEIARWRRDPYRFQPRVIPWDHSAWDQFRGLAALGAAS